MYAKPITMGTTIANTIAVVKPAVRDEYSCSPIYLSALHIKISTGLNASASAMDIWVLNKTTNDPFHNLGSVFNYTRKYQ